MAENLETPEKSIYEDDFLSQLTYKQLQQIAMSLKLPANLKYSSMLALIKARRSEDDEQVLRIMSESKQLRNRRRSRTSPVPESLTLSPPISPPECPMQTTALPLATSSPKSAYQAASQPLLAENKNLLSMTSIMTKHKDVKSASTMDNSQDLDSKESLSNSLETETTTCTAISSDRSPDPLELESPLTEGTDSTGKSFGSDKDPLTNVKECLCSSEEGAVAKDFAELKPVPPSELMDLSIPVPLLDPSVALRQTFNPDPPQHSLLNRYTSFTQALIPYTTSVESMMSNPLVSLCPADLTMNGTGYLSTSSIMALGADSAHLEVTRDDSSSVNFTLEESVLVGQNLTPRKRPSQEIENIPTKLQKTIINIDSTEAGVSTVPMNPPALLPCAVSQEPLLKLPKSITIVTLSSVATTCTAVPCTLTSMTPAQPTVQITPSPSVGERFQPSINSTIHTSSFSTQGVVGEAKANSSYTSASVATKPSSAISNRSTARCMIQSAKSFSSGIWPVQPKSNIQISDHHSKYSEPKRALTTNLKSAPKANTSNKLNIIKQPNSVKIPGPEASCVFPEMSIKPKITAQNQASPVKRPVSNQICCGTTNSCSRQGHTVRAPCATTTFASVPTTLSYNTKRLDQPHASFPNVCTTATVPTRNQPIVAPTPARPESVLNSAPTSRQTNLPSFNHSFKDLSENQKNRPQEVVHSLLSGDTLDDIVQPKVDVGPSFPPPIFKPPLVDFPSAQPALVGQNLSAGPNLSFDSSHTTLRHLLESPLSQNRDTSRRSLYNAYYHDNQHSNLLARSQAIPSDNYKDTIGVGQMGNYPALIQNFPRMAYMPRPESMDRAKTKECLADQRLGPNDLPKSLEAIYNYRGDASSLPCTTGPKLAATNRSSIIDSLFVASGLGKTQIVYCYEAAISSPRVKPTRSHLGTGNYHTGERHRAPQEFVPYSSNYPLEQNTEMYGHGVPLNATLNQPCQPWLSNDPFLPALPVNQYWPQAVNPPPPLRLTQPFRPIYARNVPNHYVSPLKPLHVPNHVAFLNQPQVDNIPYPTIPQLQDFQSYQPRDFQSYQPRDFQSYQPRDFQSYQPRDIQSHQPRDVPSFQPPNVQPHQPRDVQSHQSRDLQSYQQRDSQPYQPSDVQSYQPRDVQSYQPRDVPPYQHRDVQSYQHRDVQPYQPSELDKLLPMQENPSLVNPDPALNQNQTHQDVPDFQGRGDQLSLSMIYNYLTSTEQMPPSTPRPEYFDNQSANQRPLYSRPIFPGTITGQHGSGSAAQTTPAAATPARSKRESGPPKDTARRQEAAENITLTREAAYASVSALRKKSKWERRDTRQKCVNFENGCTLILPLSQLAEHEDNCEYISFKCPKETCEWNGRARKLATHVREVHRVEISTGTDSKHILPDIEALERVCFLQEVSRKLFAICVNCHGGVLYVSIQYIASGRSERPTSASGCIEVLGQDGHPYSWRGKLLPYFQSVESLLSTASCLEVSLSTLGALAGSTITLHVSIRVYSGNTNVAVQQSN